MLNTSFAEKAQELPAPVAIDAVTGKYYDPTEDERLESYAFDEAQLFASDRAKGRHRVGSYESPNSVSEFVEYRFNYDLNAPIQFHTRPWRPQMYDSEYTRKRLESLGADSKTIERMVRQTLEKCARQCEKSTSLGNKLLTYAALIPNTCALYVSSAGLNMQEFADERVANVIRLSPKLRPWLGKLLGDSRYYKRFARNNSRLVLRSAHLNADRVRGIPADVLAIDEIQNFIMGNIPVIEATLNNSELEYGPITVYSGTPLSFDNPIEQIWSKNSTQNMWAMTCAGCNHINFPPETPQQVDRMIGPMGLLCYRCGRALDVLGGEWIRKGRMDADFEGFHLSRCMMPYTAIHSLEAFDAKWGKFYRDVKNPNTDDASIMNEIFGVSWDSGAKPITRDELMACCHPGQRLSRHAPEHIIHDPGWPIFAGIDWGEGTGEGAYTVIVMGYLAHIPVVGEVFLVFYARRYMGSEAASTYLWHEIAELLEQNRVAVAICDAGMGWGMIDGVRENMSNGLQRLIPMRYTNQSAIMAYDAQSNQFTCNRTRWMAKIFTQLKKKRVLLPSWEAVMDGPPQTNRGFSQDILTIFADRTKNLRQMAYNHTEPDDFFHALLYAVTAQKYFYEELDMFANA